MNELMKCYQKNSAVISRRIGEKVILVPTEGKTEDLEKVYTITGSGVRIWELIDGKKSVVDIKKIIAKEFIVKPQEAENDIISFFQQLKDKNSIKAISPKAKGGAKK